MIRVALAVLISALFPGAAWASLSPLPCTSDYQWSNLSITKAIAGNAVAMLADFSEPDVVVVREGRELARGKQSTAELLAALFTSARKPTRLLVLDDALLVTFPYTRTIDVFGKPSSFLEEAALLLRCKSPGTIRAIELLSSVNIDIQKFAEADLATIDG